MTALLTDCIKLVCQQLLKSIQEQKTLDRAWACQLSTAFENLKAHEFENYGRATPVSRSFEYLALQVSVWAKQKDTGMQVI